MILRIHLDREEIQNMFDMKLFVKAVFERWRMLSRNGAVYGFIDIETNNDTSQVNLYEQLDKKLTDTYDDIIIEVLNSRGTDYPGDRYVVRPSAIISQKEKQIKNNTFRRNRIMRIEGNITNWQTFGNIEDVLKNVDDFDAKITYIFQYEFGNLKMGRRQLRIMRLDDLIETYLQVGEIQSGAHNYVSRRTMQSLTNPK